MCQASESRELVETRSAPQLLSSRPARGGPLTPAGTGHAWTNGMPAEGAAALSRPGRSCCQQRSSPSSALGQHEELAHDGEHRTRGRGRRRPRRRRPPPGRRAAGPAAAARRCRPAASGACRPVLPCPRRARSGGWLARTVLPSAPGAGKSTRSERRQTPAGRTPPPAGPGTAVRPPSRGREGRRPRDGRRTPALATAHPAGLKNGPARRVRLSQIPGQGRRERRATAAAERPGRRISAFHLDGAGRKTRLRRRPALPRHHHRPARRGHRSLRPAGLNAGAENHRLVD